MPFHRPKRREHVSFIIINVAAIDSMIMKETSNN